MLLEKRLRSLLEKFQYEGQIEIGQGGLQPHYIDSLIKDLLPFVEDEIDRHKEYSYKMGLLIGKQLQ